ncbi:MAG TPA: asparagine synthase-related protein [Acidimicrobiales bacterium]|nr:asparagine synthase-related protein [Acidimicrobiales bacterium]
MTGPEPPARPALRAPALSALDIATGMPAGIDRRLAPIDVNPSTPRDPLAVMAQVLAEGLSRPPCVVTFSGGRDSSGVLAAATQVSRDLGLPPPLPVTLVFPGDKDADEEDWQRLVIDKLGLTEWERARVSEGDLDAVGPVATAALRQHGVYWPFNAHFHIPIFQLATGGTVLTGFGGDEMGLACDTARRERILCLQERVSARAAIATLGLAAAPRPLRRAVHGHRYHNEATWLTPAGEALARKARVADQADVPFGYGRVLTRWVPRQRYFNVCKESFEALASPYHVRVLHPFIEPSVLASLAARGGIPGFGSREELVRILFGGLLPPEVITRRSKGRFNNPLYSLATAEFVRNWDRSGVNHELVDAERVADAWRAGRDVRAATLMQSAWWEAHIGSGTDSATARSVAAPPHNA